MSGVWTVDVDLALVRPPTVQRTSRVQVVADSAHDAVLLAVSMASRVHQAAMPVGSLIVDWPDV